MLHYASIVMFTIAASYSVYQILINTYKDESIFNMLMLLSLNLCMSPFNKNIIGSVLIASSLLMVGILLIAGEFRMREFKYKVNGKLVNENYLLKDGDVLTFSQLKP